MPFLTRLIKKVASKSKRKKEADEGSVNDTPSLPARAPTPPRSRGYHNYTDYYYNNPDVGPGDSTFLVHLHDPHQSATMADGEPDYSSLPITERWVHKVGAHCRIHHRR